MELVFRTFLFLLVQIHFLFFLKQKTYVDFHALYLAPLLSYFQKDCLDSKQNLEHKYRVKVVLFYNF